MVPTLIFLYFLTKNQIWPFLKPYVGDWLRDTKFASVLARPLDLPNFDQELDISKSPFGEKS